MATARQPDTAVGEAPRAGQMLPYFELPSSRGGSGGPRFYKARRSLVLLFLQKSDGARETLRGFADNYDEYGQEEAEVLAVVVASADETRRLAGELGLPFPLLADADGSAHRRFGLTTGDADALGAYVTDRYGEIGAAWPLVAGHQALPSHTALLEHLRFLGIQCPE